MRCLPADAHWAPLLMAFDGAVVSLQRQQRPAAGDLKVDTLAVDLASGACSVGRQDPFASGGARLVAALLGVLPLTHGCALAVATDVARVAHCARSAVYRVARTEVYTHAQVAADATDHRLVLLLKAALSTQGLGAHMYLSYSVDLTRSCQRQAVAEQPPASAAAAWTAADAAFAWNAHLARPMLRADAAAFVVPVISGYVGHVRFAPAPASGQDTTVSPPGVGPPAHAARVTAEATAPGQGAGEGQRDGDAPAAAQVPAAAAPARPLGEAGLLLVCRVGTARPSAGIWRRGLDAQGAAASQVETEVVVTSGRLAAPIAAHLQLSGTPPVAWWQVPDLRPSTAPRVAADGSAAALAAHWAELAGAYGEVVPLDLLRHHGPEAALRQAAAEAAAEAGAGGGGVSFDLAGAAEQQRGLAADARAALRAALAPLARSHGCWACGPRPGGGEAHAGAGAGAGRQLGALRMHSLAAVDRVGVARAVVGSLGLELCLKDSGLLPEGASLQQAHPELAAALPAVWADATQALALQLAGTRALASVGGTRRRAQDAAHDARVRLHRWWGDNYVQWRRQDALDLLHGTFRPSEGFALPWRMQPTGALMLMLLGVQLVFLLGQVALMAAGSLGGTRAEVAGMFAAPVLVGVAIVWYVLRWSDWYVCWPELCLGALPRPPPWRRDGGAGGDGGAAQDSQQAKKVQ